jgi:hypothetical protein
MGTLFLQHLFDFTPLPEQKLLFLPLGVIRERNLAEQILGSHWVEDSLNSRANHSQEGRSGSSGNTGARGRPVQQKFGRTGSIRGGAHQRCQSHMVLGIWIGTFFQEELNKVEVGHIVPGACNVQGRFALLDRYSIDVGAVFNKLFR